jgi:hypothetical protein
MSSKMFKVIDFNMPEVLREEVMDLVRNAIGKGL